MLLTEKLMVQSKFRSFLQTSIQNGTPVFFDGGMGTMIQAKGVTGFGLPEELNFTHEELIRSMHEQYISAGSQVIAANRGGASSVGRRGSLHTASEASRKAIE